VNVATQTDDNAAWRQVANSRLYLGAAWALFMSGLGVSAVAPQIVLFLVKDLGASLSVGGLYYLTSLAAPIAAYLVGRWSDRSGTRLVWFRLCAIAGCLGWAGVALSTAVWVPFVIGIVPLAFSGAAASQIFAAVHDERRQRPGEADERVVALIRMALTAGWIVGPVLGAWVSATHGTRATVWLTSICLLLQLVPLGTLEVRAAPMSPSGKPDATHIRLRAMLPLLAFTALFMLVYAGEPIKYGYLPIYMQAQLKLEPAVAGAVIGIQPLVELLIMPFCLVLGRKTSPLWLMCATAALGVGANLCFALWASATGMFAGQILMGAVWGIFMVQGILVAQQLLPGAVATATAIFMSASALASALGGVAGSLGIATWGLPSVFFLPAIFGGLAVVGLGWMARTGPTPGT
jgi:MFS transporter, SET family, sugar efflux transporter